MQISSLGRAIDLRSMGSWFDSNICNQISSFDFPVNQFEDTVTTYMLAKHDVEGSIPSLRDTGDSSTVEHEKLSIRLSSKSSNTLRGSLTGLTCIRLLI